MNESSDHLLDDYRDIGFDVEPHREAINNPVYVALFEPKPWATRRSQ